MDKPRHPNVVRTWVAGRTRHPVPSFSAPHTEDPRRGPARGRQTPPAKPAHPSGPKEESA
jgi:hypothetical protein